MNDDRFEDKDQEQRQNQNAAQPDGGETPMSDPVFRAMYENWLAEQKNAPEQEREAQPQNFQGAQSGYTPDYTGYTARPSNAQGYRNAYGSGQNTAKTKKTGRIIGIIAIIIACVMVGALLGSFVIYPILQNSGQAGQPQESVNPPIATPKPSGGGSDEKPNIGGDAPNITNQANPVPEIAENLADSVVGVTSYGKVQTQDGRTAESPVSRGTGFFISADGYVLTNNHIIEGATAVTVTTHDGEEHRAAIIGSDASLDVAVLKAEGSGYSAMPMGDSDESRVGELAIVIGNPAGAGENLVGSVTVGYVSAVDRELLFNGSRQKFIQTDAAVNPGNSGGPMVNADGKVIGMITLKSLVSSVDAYGSPINTEGIGFAIPINSALDAANQIIETGSVKKPGIGIEYITITEADAQIRGLVAGYQVKTVKDGGPADQAGMQVDDIIIGYNGNQFAEDEDLAQIIAGKKVGDTISVLVWRNGQEVTIDLTLGDLNAMNS